LGGGSFLHWAAHRTGEHPGEVVDREREIDEIIGEDEIRGLADHGADPTHSTTTFPLFRLGVRLEVGFPHILDLREALEVRLDEAGTLAELELIRSHRSGSSTTIPESGLVCGHGILPSAAWFVDFPLH